MRPRALAVLGLIAMLTTGHAAAAAEGACPSPGRWIDPATGAEPSHPQVIAAMAKRPVVLLGETHTDAAHHRWELDMLAGLYGRNANMAIGFESFPRATQPVLDQWVAGKLSEDAFLKAVDWDKIWGFDPQLYMPLFRFARMYRIPMVALNVDRALVDRVGHVGWAAVPAAERAGISTPAPALQAYRDRLRKVFDMHAKQVAPKGGMGDFDHFVDAQLTWDRAMAQAIAEERRKTTPSGQPRLVVAIIGAGHLRYRYGVPYQLADLGVSNAAVLLPWRAEEGCGDLAPAGDPSIADAVFMLDPRSAAPEGHGWKPKLGVLIETADGGVRISRVVDGSVADKAGLEAGDVVVTAAGVRVKASGDLVDVIHRQAPGTWLPLTIHRGGRTQDVVAKFPTSP